MYVPRPLLLFLLLTHILVVWGSIGLLGGGWSRVALCSASKIQVFSMALGLFGSLATLSPIVGLISVWKIRLQPYYLGLVALTLFTIWLSDYLNQIGVFYCDGP